jgi:predicted P-loop ATPase
MLKIIGDSPMVSAPSSKQNLPKGVSQAEEYKTGNILDHLDKLEPSKGGKYICPVCEGNDLSINKKTGAPTCFNNECSWKSIMDIIAPLEKSPRGKSTKTKATTKFKSKTQKDKDAIAAEITIDSKVTEILYELECGSHSPASASIALAAWCKEHGHNAYTAGQLLKEKTKKLKENSSWDEDELTPLLLKDYQKIEDKFGDRLRFNQLFSQVELDGEVFHPAMAKIEFIVAHRLKLKSGREDIADCVLRIARQNQYHPVKEYLEAVFERHGKDTTILNNFADRHFGTTEHIHQVATVKFLIGAVARACDPGCQVDTALILQGGQGFFKSSFFRELASPEWFDDGFGNASDKDERLKLHCSWILEWAELETIFKRKDVAAVKAFMTTKIDRLRPPYGRVIESMARASVFCGSTNQAEFLSDSTGNRRFWVVPVAREIDCKALAAERDRVWAAAMALYKAGVDWWLTPEEEAAMSSSRGTYESSDAWEEEIEDYLRGLEETTIQKILTHCLKIELAQQDKRSQIRVREILTRLNWLHQVNPVYREGKRVRIWTPQTVLPNIYCVTVSEQSNELV